MGDTQRAYSRHDLADLLRSLWANHDVSEGLGQRLNEIADQVEDEDPRLLTAEEFEFLRGHVSFPSGTRSIYLKLKKQAGPAPQGEEQVGDIASEPAISTSFPRIVKRLAE